VSGQSLIAKYYRAQDGSQPVRDFIDALLPRQAANVFGQIDRINELCTETSPHLPFPNTSQVDGELRELRCHSGRDLFRILYRRSRRFVVLLHAIEKRTAKIPPEAIVIANSRWADFKARMDADPRTPPSPLGTGRAP